MNESISRADHNKKKPTKKQYLLRRAAALTLLLTAGTAGVNVAKSSLKAAEPMTPVEQLHPDEVTPYVAQPGDTPWQIARNFHGEGEIRPLVDELQRQAGVDGLQVGEQVLVPNDQIHQDTSE